MSTDYEDKYIFVAGYHDGKLTVLRINDDGSVGEITEEIYYKAWGLWRRGISGRISAVRR